MPHLNYVSGGGSSHVALRCGIKPFKAPAEVKQNVNLTLVA